MSADPAETPHGGSETSNMRPQEIWRRFHVCWHAPYQVLDDEVALGTSGWEILRAHSGSTPLSFRMVLTQATFPLSLPFRTVGRNSRPACAEPFVLASISSSESDVAWPPSPPVLLLGHSSCRLLSSLIVQHVGAVKIEWHIGLHRVHCALWQLHIWDLPILVLPANHKLLDANVLSAEVGQHVDEHVQG